MDGEAAGPRSRGWIWWITGLLVVAVLGAAGTVIGLDSRVHNPADVQKIAEEYAAAIAAGDAERANEIAVIDPTIETGEILDSDALSHAEHISGAIVDRFRVDFDRGRASGRVSFELEGASYSDRIELEQGASGKWRVVSGLRYLLPSDLGTSGVLALSGMDDAVPDSGMATAYAGSYRVISLSELYAPAGSDRLRATPDVSWSGSAPEMQPTQKLRELVGEEPADHYTACSSARTVDELGECGIEVGEAADDVVGETRFSIEVVELPDFTLDDSEPGWGVVPGAGEFEITVTGRDDRGRVIDRTVTGRATYADLEFTVTGSEVSLELLPY